MIHGTVHNIHLVGSDVNPLAHVYGPNGVFQKLQPGHFIIEKSPTGPTKTYSASSIRASIGDCVKSVLFIVW
jgi:hypothetical protein